MNIAPTQWLTIGPYRVLKHPLAGNPAFATHWIYRNGALVGKLLSVPNLADCAHVERWGERYADEKPPKIVSYRLRGATKAKHRSTA